MDPRLTTIEQYAGGVVTAELHKTENVCDFETFNITVEPVQQR